MPGDDERVYGLKGVTHLVRQFMTRVERGGTLSSLDFPVLVVEGFRGTGKSALLTRLAGLLGHVPHARLDLEKNRHASVPEVLSAIAFDLSKKYPRYELRFPRFIVGQLVAGLDLDLTDHSVACRQVEAALREYRDFDAVRQVLVDTAGSVLAGVSHSAGVPIKPPEGLLRALANWLAERAPGRAMTLGPFQGWYGHRDLGLHHHAIDVLVDLNRWAADAEDEDNRLRIDELLLAAFLADLRAEFDRGRRADERSLNCVVLLDDADTELGRRFLAQLVTTRRQRAVGEQDGADPLTVVVTSRGGLLADVPDADQAMVEPEALRTEAYDVADLSRHWWLGVHGCPTSPSDEVGRAAADMGLAWGNNQRITRVVHDLTGGHPAATSIVLDTLARGAPDPLGRARGHPRPAPTPCPAKGPRWRTGSSAGCSSGMSDGVRQDLITCAAARHHAHALALAGVDGMLVNGRVAYEVVDRVLWPAGGAAGLTLLRRLLTRRLAAREKPDGPCWSDVHATAAPPLPGRGRRGRRPALRPRRRRARLRRHPAARAARRARQHRVVRAGHHRRVRTPPRAGRPAPPIDAVRDAVEARRASTRRLTACRAPGRGAAGRGRPVRRQPAPRRAPADRRRLRGGRAAVPRRAARGLPRGVAQAPEGGRVVGLTGNEAARAGSSRRSPKASAGAAARRRIAIAVVVAARRRRRRVGCEPPC